MESWDVAGITLLLVPKQDVMKACREHGDEAALS
jgi:hypothetical protein